MRREAQAEVTTAPPLSDATWRLERRYGDIDVQWRARFMVLALAILGAGCCVETAGLGGLCSGGGGLNVSQDVDVDQRQNQPPCDNCETGSGLGFACELAGCSDAGCSAVACTWTDGAAHTIRVRDTETGETFEGVRRSGEIYDPEVGGVARTVTVELVEGGAVIAGPVGPLRLAS